LLELAILGGVDERVDDAVDENQDHSEVVVPASEVDCVPEVVEKKGNRVRHPAHNESTAYHQ